MAEIKFKTKGNAEPHGKPRVYFTCHPDDFDKYFDMICEDIFATHEPAIFYTPNMSEPHDMENMETDLGRANLFVIPVTYRLLTDPNRAMQVDIAYAKEKNIPILPFMMGTGIDAVYSLTKNFGERQYISPFSTDSTEISYKEKLKKYLDVILISEEMARRIRAAFDAYIFLSYRKKDRKYANELMKIIHSIPGCYDVAIWYDEFLIPGESFVKNIEKVMDKSKLFTLLVTPNLLEFVENKGNLEPNFVMRVEYPAAKTSGKPILPTEMEKTDREALKAKYEELPDPVHTDESRFKEMLLSSLKRIAISENENDPEHNFLIGLAYLDGIDVEVDVDRSISLITMSAEAGLPEAMKKLYNIYRNGNKVGIDYNEAMKWAKCLVDCYTEELGSGHIDTLRAVNNLAISYSELGLFQEAVDTLEYAYKCCCDTHGEKAPISVSTLGHLASAYENAGNYGKAHKLHLKLLAITKDSPNTTMRDIGYILLSLASDFYHMGDYMRAIEAFAEVYNANCATLGEEHEETLAVLSNLAATYSTVDNHEKSYELYERCYSINKKLHGENHPDTLSALSGIAGYYDDIGDFKKATEINEKVYSMRRKLLGENHPDTLSVLNNLASNYSNMAEHSRAIEIRERVYALSCDLLGEDHPRTLTFLNNLAHDYRDIKEYSKAIELGERVYGCRSKSLGEGHIDTLACLVDMASDYFFIKNMGKARELCKKAYNVYCQTFIGDNLRMLIVLNNIAVTSYNAGDYELAAEVFEKSVDKRCSLLGEDHKDSISSLTNLSDSYDKLGETQKAVEVKERLYRIRCKALGEDNPEMIKLLGEIISDYDSLGEERKALPLKKKVYELMSSTLGEEHDDTQMALHDLAFAYRNLDYYNEALELFNSAYSMYLDMYGEKNIVTLTAMDNLAFTYVGMGEFEKTVDLFNRVYNIYCDYAGESHPNTIIALENLAYACRDVNDHERARSMFEKLYTTNLNKHGERKYDTVNAKKELAISYSDLGMNERAAELLEECYAICLEKFSTGSFISEVREHLKNLKK